ncbi:hypothetical protein C1645_821988 [Glomus cerebriforme]|uniref:Uncharacterized protein n=1 Tax=Glomus cerebriforme TaxID=658196 RepID=A0A397SZ44_9GLOM|nr:hypothetical protein C1645_821988 [Glomus cerebriforme]
MSFRFKANIQIKNDATMLIENLIKLHVENAEWYFKVNFKNFENHWRNLMAQYPEVQKYCEHVLYPTRTCWTYAFTKCSFLANTHSATQCVETLQHKQMVESSLYKTWIKKNKDINSAVKDCYDEGFVKDDYEEA